MRDGFAAGVVDPPLGIQGHEQGAQVWIPALDEEGLAAVEAESKEPKEGNIFLFCIAFHLAFMSNGGTLTVNPCDMG